MSVRMPDIDPILALTPLDVYLHIVIYPSAARKEMFPVMLCALPYTRNMSSDGAPRVYTRGPVAARVQLHDRSATVENRLDYWKTNY
jgi:hypothetical protein